VVWYGTDVSEDPTAATVTHTYPDDGSCTCLLNARILIHRLHCVTSHTAPSSVLTARNTGDVINIWPRQRPLYWLL